ncbi:hypothetical protein ACQUW5_14940 [Legionella sp. CNM-1927-20]|uniref:hypothetical protein n=1 Tax=Legionella sp. CNM-1927-20 TaxID=3422221 RepID=UPI00403AA5B3
MRFKTEPTTRRIIFDIYDKMSVSEARMALTENFAKLEERELTGIKILGEPLWLLRKSDDPGVLTIEYMTYDWNKGGLANQKAVRSLQLTKNGWQPYDSSYNKDDLLEITKDNIDADRLRELEEFFKKHPRYKRENMIYPEIEWAIQEDKATRENASNTSHFRPVRPCPDAQKGLLRRSNTTSSQSQGMYLAQRIVQEQEKTPQLETIHAPTKTPESIIYSKSITPQGIQAILNSKLGSLDASKIETLCSTGGSVWLIRDSNVEGSLTVESLKYNKDKRQWEEQPPRRFTLTEKGGWVENPYRLGSKEYDDLMKANGGRVILAKTINEELSSLLDILSNDGYREEYRSRPILKEPPAWHNVSGLRNKVPASTRPVHASTNIHYKYKVDSQEEGRNHIFKASYAGMKAELQTLKGDFLKSKILSDFQSKISKATNKKELEAIVNKLKFIDGDSEKGLTPEYSVIKTGQGRATRLLGLQTTSDKALDAIIQDQENYITKSSACNP